METEDIFGRKRKDGFYDILDVDTEEKVTQLNIDEYPLDEEYFSSREAHPDGLVLSKMQMTRYGIYIESNFKNYSISLDVESIFVLDHTLNQGESRSKWIRDAIDMRLALKRSTL